MFLPSGWLTLGPGAEPRISLIHLRKAMTDAAMDEDQLQLVGARFLGDGDDTGWTEMGLEMGNGNY